MRESKRVVVGMSNMDNLTYRGKTICVLYDKTGDKYKRGAGLSIFINGTKTATSPTLTKISCKL